MGFEGRTPSSEDRVCVNCNHSDICKYKEDFTKAYNEIEDVGDKNEVFLTVTVKCKHWMAGITNVR